MSDTPKVRFKGFTDAWEQCKLGDISLSFEYGLNVAAKEFDGENKYIRITDINDCTHEFMTDNVTSPDTDLLNAENYKLSVGDILFARTGASVGKSYIYRESDGLVYYAGFLIRARIKDEVNPEFAFQNTLTRDYEKFIAVTSQRSGQPGINAQEYAEYTIMLPTRAEQDKISAYLKNLDHLIILHQRRCDETKELKKYMLQKMFPQAGKKIPEIRFAGFADDWEQRKLGDVLEDLYNGQTPSRFKEDYWNGDVSWLSSGELNRGIVYESIEKITEAGQKSANLRIVPKGTFVMAITGLEATGTRGNCAILGFDTTLNQSCMALYPKKKVVTSEFLFQWYRMVGENYGIRFTQGTKQQSYNAEIIKDLDISVPKLEEQHKITKALFTLDHLIILHQRKCNQLKEVKKSMLQNMFPQKG